MDYFYSALGYSTAEPAAVEEEAAAAAAPAGQYAQPEQEAAGGEADAPADGDAYANTVRPIRHGAALARGCTPRLRPAGSGIEGPKEPRDARSHSTSVVSRPLSLTLRAHFASPASSRASCQALTEGEEEEDPEQAARRRSLIESRKESWLLEATQETSRLGSNLLDDGLLEMDEAMMASMAALQSALALEESVLQQDAPVALASVDATDAALDPGSSAAAALLGSAPSGGVQTVDASALINATALLGPGAGGLLPVSAGPSLLPGGDAWDEMEKRMAALSATLEGGDGGLAGAGNDEARLAARAARMREREAKRQAKRTGVAHTSASGTGLSAASVSLAPPGYGMGAQQRSVASVPVVVGPAVAVAPTPGGRVIIQPGVVRAREGREARAHSCLLTLLLLPNHTLAHTRGSGPRIQQTGPVDDHVRGAAGAARPRAEGG